MVLKIKKQRHRPLYKNFINLKKNIQNRRRLNLFKFKKRKWEKLVLHLKRLQNRRKKKFIMYDMNRYFLSRFYNSFKRKYNNILQTKRKLRLFYGSLLQKNVRVILAKFLKKKNMILKDSGNLKIFFLSLFEQKLDVILYRCHFVQSIRAAKQLIAHNHVMVNDKVVNKSSYIIKKSDLIKIKSSGFKIVTSNIKSSHFWPMPPKYLNINYKTFQILCNDHIRNSNFAIHFSSWFDFHSLKNSI